MNLVGRGRYSKAELEKLGDARGVSRQDRNYFWYQRSFQAPAPHATAILEVGKAQFGTKVFLNGQPLGEHDSCFTAGYFDASKWIRWGRENQLTIRIGAHPGVLPGKVFAGTDFEKNLWTPGIYDDVLLQAFDGPGITNVQVAPKIESSEILVQTELHNYGVASETTTLQHDVTEWKLANEVVAPAPLTLTLAPGETRLVEQSITLPHAHLWAPEDPFLYQLHSRTTGDSLSTRFGMRELRFDTVTQRAYLNGKPYFLRGSNIALHRFFDDPLSGTLPWNEAWLQKLLGQIPKEMHWNTFRFSIGPVPDRWLEIADEQGLLIQNEYMVWTGDLPVTHPEHKLYDVEELTGEFKEWMRDNWNHASVVIWDASNESLIPDFAQKIIPAVRSLDLSNRPWEDSYNPPSGSNDPVEDHPYLWVDNANTGEWHFKMSDLESMQGLTAVEEHHEDRSRDDPQRGMDGFGSIADGSPTLLTNKLYPMLVGKNSTADERFAMQAYLLAGETEFWRAYRRYAGVLHFAYLTGSDQQAFTADHFTDIKNLTLEPHFYDYVRQAFQPLGVYINFFHPTLTGAAQKTFTVLMVNDTAALKAGTLQLQFLDSANKIASATESAFRLEALGADSYNLTLTAPSAPGKYTLRATATAAGAAADPTLSRRWVTILAPSPEVRRQ